MAWLLTHDFSEEFRVQWRFEDSQVTKRIEFSTGPELTSEEVNWLSRARVLVEWSKDDPLPDILSFNAYPQICSKRVANIVSDLEPDTHTFTRLNLIFADTGMPVKGHYFSVVVSRKIPAVIREESSISESQLMNGDVIEWLSPSPWKKRTLIGAEIAGYHLFRDTAFPSALFCSDQLKAELENLPADISFNPCTVV